MWKLTFLTENSTEALRLATDGLQTFASLLSALSERYVDQIRPEPPFYNGYSRSGQLRLNCNVFIGPRP